MKIKNAVEALSALAQESRLVIFRLLLPGKFIGITDACWLALRKRYAFQSDRSSVGARLHRFQHVDFHRRARFVEQPE